MLQNLISMIRTSAVQFENLWYFYRAFGGIQYSILKCNRRASNFRRRNLNIILSLRIPDKTATANSRSQLPAENYRSENRNCRNKYRCTAGQSDQLKNRKFYENLSEYANFSKSSGKGHKTKGQILIYSQGSLWTKV